MYSIFLPEMAQIILTLDAMDDETEFSKAALNRILQVIRENRFLLLESWKELHG